MKDSGGICARHLCLYPKLQVLHLPLSNGRVVAEEITELFYDHGDLISASTVAHLRNEQLLIGSIINKLVVCDMRGKATHKEGGKK